jgi:hypothetical protein
MTDFITEHSSTQETNTMDEHEMQWFVEPGSDNKSCDGEHDLEVDDDIPQSGDNCIDEYSFGVDDCKCIGVVDASYEGSLLMFRIDSAFYFRNCISNN